MKGSYDKEHDIAYVQFSSKKPEGAIQIDEGVVLDTTEKDEIVGIEIFDASKRLPLETLYKVILIPESGS